MSMVTIGTDDPADAQGALSNRHFQGTGIIPVNRKATGMTAGTGQSVRLQTCNKIIIKSLRNRIVIFDKYGYHSIVNPWEYLWVVGEAGNQTLVGEVPASFVSSNFVMIA